MGKKPEIISSEGMYLRTGKILALRQKCGPDEKIAIRNNDFVIVKKLHVRAMQKLSSLANTKIAPRRWFPIKKTD